VKGVLVKKCKPPKFNGEDGGGLWGSFFKELLLSSVVLEERRKEHDTEKKVAKHNKQLREGEKEGFKGYGKGGLGRRKRKRTLP